MMSRVIQTMALLVALAQPVTAQRGDRISEVGSSFTRNERVYYIYRGVEIHGDMWLSDYTAIQAALSEQQSEGHTVQRVNVGNEVRRWLFPSTDLGSGRAPWR